MSEAADVIIVGAGASGLMCAIEAGRRHRKVMVIDHADQAGRKLVISGGGRCNFTNIQIQADHYISHNPHFCKSALSQYTQWDFLALVRKHHIAFSERDQGRLFCANSSADILHMLLTECRQVGVCLCLNSSIEKIEGLGEGGFIVHSRACEYRCRSLVVATGGLSMPSIGASALGYAIAAQFAIKVWPPTAGLVPLRFSPQDQQRLAPLSGIALEALVRTGHHSFRENLLFTHRGVSGPAILQISSYWQPGDAVIINLLPAITLIDELRTHQQHHPRRTVKSVVAHYLPKRLVAAFLDKELAERPLQTVAQRQFHDISACFQQWALTPGGTEGYRTAEVTVGGVDCDAVSSKTMQARQVPGLFFCGEVLDVTGWLGGYNLQWAWSSGWCAGQHA